MKLSFRLRRADMSTSFESLMQLVQMYPDCIDECAFFVDLCEHCYAPLETMRTWAEQTKEMFARLRQAGVRSVGYNFCDTMGQNNDSWEWMEPSPYQTVVGKDGGTCTGTICPRAPGFEAYMCEKYRCFAEAGPDFIWVDDDFRVFYHSVDYLCFCDHCVAEFCRQQNLNYDRQQLVDALQWSGDKALRQAWIRFTADGMCNLLEAVRKAVHSVNPNIYLGFMGTDVGENFYTFSNFKEMMDALQSKMFRPGGGFWEASHPQFFFNKMINCAYQNWEAGPAPDILYESENIPHLDGKPQRIHALEMTASLMIGCNGIAVNGVFGSQPEAASRLLDTLRKNRPFWEKLVDRMDGWPLVGGVIGYRRDAAVHSRSKDWFDARTVWDFVETRQFFEAGFAFTTDKRQADYVLLSGALVDAFSDEALKQILSGAVIMDGEAAHRLAERNLGQYCGSDCCQKVYRSGLREIFLPVFGIAATPNRRRGGAQSQFRKNEGICLARMLEGAIPLSEVISTSNDFCGYGTYLWENALGGRVAVLNYVPWGLFVQQERVNMLRHVVRWVCRERQTLDLGDSRRLLPILRMQPDRKQFVLMLTNAWLDPSIPAEVKLAGIWERVYCYHPETGHTQQLSTSTENGVTIFTVPALNGWEHVIVSSEPFLN